MTKEEREDIKNLRDILIYLGEKISIGVVEPIL